MKRVSVVTAANPGFQNAGMLSVDFAFADVCKDAVPDAEIKWYSANGAESEGQSVRGYLKGQKLPFKIQAVSSVTPDMIGSEAIVFWGDFLQARHYIVGEASQRLVNSGAASNMADAASRLMRILLLSEESDETLRKAVVAGGTILLNRQSDYSDEAYTNSFFRLMREAREVWMRDAISACKVAQFRNGGVRVNQGADCALLLSDESVDQMRKTNWSGSLAVKEKIGVFFGGRTNASAGAVASFLREVARHSDCELDWLPWFGFDYPRYVGMREAFKSPGAFLSYRTNRGDINGFMRRSEDYSFGDLLEALRRYRFVITDTYHVCVNSWRAGTPAVCIADSRPLGSTPKHALSLTDYKKLTLYAMYDALDYYVETDDLHDAVRRGERLAELLAAVGSKSANEGVVSRIRTHASGVRDGVKGALRALLGE